MLNTKIVENAKTLILSEKINRLFLSWNCSGCIPIKDLLMNNNIICNDEIKGKNGQSLSVFYTFNNISTRDLLNCFNLINYFTPVLITWDKKILTEQEEIVNYLQNCGIINKV